MSKNPMYTCLWFNNQGKEAAEFYCSTFKNSQITASNPMVTTFEIEGKKFMCLNGGPQFKMNASISAFVVCTSTEEVDRLWNKLIEGGKAMMPLDKYDWSQRYGWLQDKFGFTWQISFDEKAKKQNIRPSLLFTRNAFGKAEEAINFYSSVIKNSKTTLLFHYPKGTPHEGKVLYSEFELNGYELIAMDGPGDHTFQFDEGISLVIECDTQQEIDHYWNSFTKNGGKESMCGWCADKFGVWWQVVPSKLGAWMSDPVKGPKVVEAFMKMKKFDIATLEKA
jgi:predicted 3-demethylubiquinone-9 3-methyltransferase (glyoxalase superfamily)